MGLLCGTITYGSDTEPAPRYLVMFLHRHVEFRLPELEAVAELVLGRGVLVVEPPGSGAHPWSPFRHVWLPSDDAARAIAARALLVKARPAARASCRGYLWGGKRSPSHWRDTAGAAAWVSEPGGCRWFQQTKGDPLILIRVVSSSCKSACRSMSMRITSRALPSGAAQVPPFGAL